MIPFGTFSNGFKSKMMKRFSPSIEATAASILFIGAMRGGVVIGNLQ